MEYVAIVKIVPRDSEEANKAGLRERDSLLSLSTS